MFYRTAPSSSGLGLWLLKPATGVRIPSELLLLLIYLLFLSRYSVNLAAVAATAAA